MLLRRISLEWRRRASNFRYGAITRGCSSSTSHSGCLSAQARPRSSFSCAGAQHHQPTGHRTSYPLLDGRLSPLSLCSWRETPLRRLHSSSSSSSSSSTRRRHHEFTVITQGCENFSSRRSYSSSSSSSIDMATTKHLVTDIRLTSDLEWVETRFLPFVSKGLNCNVMIFIAGAMSSTASWPWRPPSTTCLTKTSART